MDEYDLAAKQLEDADRFLGADPQARFLSALSHGVLALIDRVDYLTYLMYGEE